MSEAAARLKPSAQTAQATITSHGAAIDAVRSAIATRTLAAVASMALSLLGCDAGNSTATSVAPQRSGAAHHALTISGYNYTNRYIDNFSVNSQGGGNISVSTPTSGGGGGTCCIGWTDGTPLPQTLSVQWSVPSCDTKVTNSDGDTRTVTVTSSTKRDVQLNGPVPTDPGYFEVHFYPDDHVEVAITEHPSEPRLKLDPAREIRAYPPCKPKP